MMKTQFSTVLLALVLIFTTNCSSDDSLNNNDPEVNELIGQWKPIQEIIIDNSGSQMTTNYDACVQMGRLMFDEDNDFENIGYYPASGNCQVEFDNAGNWQIVNNNTLRINLNGQVDNGFIGDYLILENTTTTLRIDADTNQNSIEQEIYVLEKVN